LKALISLILYLLCVVTFVICAAIYIPLIIFWGPAKAVWFRRFYGWIIIKMTFSRLIINNQPLANSGPFLFVPNHESLFDIFMIAAAIPQHFSAIAKKELFSVPLFGFIIKKMDIVSIDRKNHVNSMSGLNQAVEKLKNGTSVIIFPEGTRSRDGQIGVFKKGAFKLALDAKVTIVPVGISGAYEAQPANTWLIYPGSVIVNFGSPIGYQDYHHLSISELSDLIKQQIIKLSSNP